MGQTFIRMNVLYCIYIGYFINAGIIGYRMNSALRHRPMTSSRWDEFTRLLSSNRRYIRWSWILLTDTPRLPFPTSSPHRVLCRTFRIPSQSFIWNQWDRYIFIIYVYVIFTQMTIDSFRVMLSNRRHQSTQLNCTAPVHSVLSGDLRYFLHELIEVELNAQNEPKPHRNMGTYKIGSVGTTALLTNFWMV